jgi:hypothetical protein
VCARVCMNTKYSRSLTFIRTLLLITSSEDDAHRGARCIARSIQQLGFRVRFRHYRVVNCLATCSMPWPIDIIKLSRMYPERVR